jgi:glycosyltransferase involved in cell wall biosynthesis
MFGEVMDLSISVVIPTFNSSLVLERCIISVKNQTFPAKEIIVCDAGSTDNTSEIARSNGAVVISARPNRSLQRNTGALETTSTYILFVDSDMQLTENVLEECVLGMKDGVAGLVMPEFDIGTSYWAKVKGFERTFYQDAWWLQASRCYRRSEFMEIGGFDVGLVGPEDWDLDERIKVFGIIERISSVIYHNEGNTTLKKILKKKSHYSDSFDRFSVSHPERAKKCFSIIKRFSLFIKAPIRLMKSPILFGGLMVLGFSEVLITTGVFKLKAIKTNEKSLNQSLNPIMARNLK